MKKKIGIIVGVVVVIVAIVVGVMFFAPEKEASKEKPSENSQTEVGSGNVETMKDTIDLNKVDLGEYGISDDFEISESYPSSLGSVYLVRDYGAEEEKTYLFVTTKEDVMYTDTQAVSAGRLSVNDTTAGTYKLQLADVDGKTGEEIVLLVNTGGNGGKGINCNSIWKINEGKIEAVKINEEEAFDVSLKAPFTVVFKNDALNYVKEFVCKTDSEALFDESGNPEDNGEYDGGFYPPHDIEISKNSDGKCIVTFTSWSYLSRSSDNDVESVVKYVFDESKQELVICDAYVNAD